MKITIVKEKIETENPNKFVVTVKAMGHEVSINKFFKDLYPFCRKYSLSVQAESKGE